MQCKDNANIIQIFIYYFHAHSSVLTHKTCIFNVKWCEGLQLLVQTRKKHKYEIRRNEKCNKILRNASYFSMKCKKSCLKFYYFIIDVCLSRTMVCVLSKSRWRIRALNASFCRSFWVQSKVHAFSYLYVQQKLDYMRDQTCFISRF